MSRTIIIHGMPSKEEYLDSARPSPADAHWIPWLKRELEQVGTSAEAPEMPVPYEPSYNAWRKVFETLPIDEHTNLVGHSCGAGFIIRWLSENKIVVGKVVLVAPWTDPSHTSAPNMFSNWEIDASIALRADSICIFVSLDDDQEILDSVAQLQAALPESNIQTFTHRGHFTLGDMGTEEFPELLEHLTHKSE